MERKHAASLACRIAPALLNYDALNPDPTAVNPGVSKKLFRPKPRSKCTMKTLDLPAQNNALLRLSARKPAGRLESEDHS